MIFKETILSKSESTMDELMYDTDIDNIAQIKMQYQKYQNSSQGKLDKLEEKIHDNLDLINNIICKESQQMMYRLDNLVSANQNNLYTDKLNEIAKIAEIELGNENQLKLKLYELCNCTKDIIGYESDIIEQINRIEYDTDNLVETLNNVHESIKVAIYAMEIITLLPNKNDCQYFVNQINDIGRNTKYVTIHRIISIIRELRNNTNHVEKFERIKY